MARAPVTWSIKPHMYALQTYFSQGIKLLVAIVLHPSLAVFISVGLLLVGCVNPGVTCGIYWAMHSYFI